MARPRLSVADASMLAGVALALAVFAVVALPAYSYLMVTWIHIPAADVLVYTVPLELLSLLAAVKLTRWRRRAVRAGARQPAALPQEK